MAPDSRRLLDPTDTFVRRHLGSNDAEVGEMLATLGLQSLDELIEQTVPKSIRIAEPLRLAGLDDGERQAGETETLERLRTMVGRNQVFRSYLGMGYHDCIVPGVIQRNILENPSWYTQYTPYQAEISQGRLEALLDFQTMVADLTGLPVANASLLDEATAAAEAMTMAHRMSRGKKSRFFAGRDCHPQTLAVLATRARGPGIELAVGDHGDCDLDDPDLFGVLLQYPASDGRIHDYRALIAGARDAGVVTVMACDLLALCLLTPPGELGADVAVGSAQRFGVPLGYGGPHAAFMAAGEDAKRQMPGRIIGVSRDRHGNTAYRMAMQTREQHIRREKATSNICTAQVLLAVMAGMYGVYHGPEGLRRIAVRVRALTATLAAGLRRLGLGLGEAAYFDTLRIEVGPGKADAVVDRARARRMNLRRLDGGTVAVALDEAATAEDVTALLEVFADGRKVPSIDELASEIDPAVPSPHARSSEYLTHPVFHRYHTEHEMLRYIHRLEARDLSLTTSMIPLGSCTMKLNATSEMVPVTWPEIGRLHPFAPVEQAEGYRRLFDELESWLCSITGFDAFSLQPNSGAQGEYAALTVIDAYHRSRGDGHRDVCLVPKSAHGTNPASAVMAGLSVVVVATDERGNVDLEDLRARAAEHADRLAALMITYPSTHGVFEEAVREVCDVVHRHGGQVFLDGANLNAQVGLCRPADYGADVCHLNLHKTFCIPHGGGGPGMGPIGMVAHLAPFRPGHPVIAVGGAPGSGGSKNGKTGDDELRTVAAAPWGSPSILPISWAYVAMMGPRGLTRASQLAILNANYMESRLIEHYPIVYRGDQGRVAHEFILDLRPFENTAGIDVEDVAKRLMDYGFHAPTMSFPIPGTLMIEPTESESKAELDRFCDAMILIREEIRAIEEGRMDRDDNPLKNAPHTQQDLASDDWPHPYGRTLAAFPAPWLAEKKFWPFVSRIDNVWGDRHVICTCPPIDGYENADESPG